MLKIELGKYYQTADGKIAGPITRNEKSNWFVYRGDVTGSKQQVWDRVGRYWGPFNSHPLDLVVECPIGKTHCPTCNCNWRYSKPAQVAYSDKIRCINCKAVFDPPYDPTMQPFDEPFRHVDTASESEMK